MALVVYDRVQETTTTAGTGSVTLDGAVTGYQTFAVVGDSNTTYYCIAGQGTAEWEVGIGTYSTTGPTLSRDTVLSSSNGNALVSFSSGPKSVFVTYPAEKSINYDANGVATIGSTLGYSDTGIVGSFASTVAGYNQVIIQNKSNASNASTNFNVSNDVGTAGSNYAELGINSSTFSGTGSFNIAGASYLASASTDLTIGTYGAYNLHFVTNSSTTDAMTIFNSGGVSLGGQPDPGIGTLYANNVYLGFNTITAAAGTTVLTNASAGYQNVVGTTTQTIQLPVATTLYKGLAFTVANASTGNVTIKDSASTTIDTIVTGGTSILVLTNNGTSAGTWVAYSYVPSSYDFSASTANFGGATLTNGLWNGTTIGTGYGGTGLTTFTAANNALYSTSSSTLTAGTLPIAAGGTGATTFTTNGVVYGNGTSALGVTGAGTTGQVLIATTSGAPSWGSVPTTAAVTSFSAGTTGLTPSTATTGAITLAGTLAIANGGTGITSFGTGVQTALGSNVTGSGGIVLATSPSLVTPALGTPTSGNFSTGTFTWPTFNQNTTGSAGSVANALTLNNSGTGAASGTTFNGSSAVILSYNTIGAAPSSGSTNITSLGNVTTGTWSANVISTTYGGTGVAGTLTGIAYMNGASAYTAATGTQISTALGSTAISGQSGSVANSITFNNAGAGAASGTVYNGSTAYTISYNTIGAQAAGSYVTSVTGTSPVSSSGGTTPAISLATGYGDTQNPYASKTANYFLAAPNGSAGAPTFRAIVAADIPTLNQNTTGTASNVTGTVGIGNGGTGQTTASAAFNALSPITTTGDLIVGNGTNSATRLGIGTNGYVLQSNGTTATWASPPGSTTLSTAEFTATAGQTSFSVTYTPALLEGVYRNGIKLGTADYTATSGTSIVLGTGAIVGDLIQVVYFSSLATSTAVNSISFGSTGLTPSTASTGAVTVAGTLAVANGGTGVTTSTGSGNVVLSTSPTLVTPALGTPSSGTLTSCTGLPLSTGVTGTLPAANGGTAQSTYATGDTLYASAANTLSKLTIGTTGQVLTVSGGVPTWATASGGGGATITGTTSNLTYYIVGTTSTSGSLSTASISNTNAVSYNASTGALTAVSVVSSSDERLKTNWVNLDTDFVTRLADVKHGTFERISSGNREVGVTAQSLKEVLPEAVIEGEEGYLSVNYGGAALVAAIELAKEVKELRAEIKALKAELNK